MSIVGCIDELSAGRLTGWAVDQSQPGTPVEVVAFNDGREIGRAIANERRGDLESLAPEGRCAFTIQTTEPAEPTFIVTVAGVALPRATAFRVVQASPPPKRSRFEERAPSHQNAIDIFEAWASDLSPIFPGAISGPAGHFSLDDPRVATAARLLGSNGRLDGMHILELGPLEGGHSYMLEQFGAESIVAIEANRDAYLKCLVAKEIAGLKRVKFMLGDFCAYMAQTDDRFDMVFAVGILYHLPDPIQTIQSICRLTDKAFVWSHVYDDQTYNGPPRASVRDNRFPHIELFEWDYADTMNDPKFWGGNKRVNRWMRKDDMIETFRTNGLSRISIVPSSPVNGHATVSFAASR